MSMLLPRSSPLAEGDVAPDFVLKDQNKQDWRLSDHVKKGDVVLAFYPMDFTGVCGSENECLTNEMSRWKEAGITMVAISCDSFAVHKAWADKMGYKHHLLADMHRQVCRAYGMYWPELNVARRGTVIVAQSDDGQGKVKWVQARDSGKPMDLDEVLAHVS